MRWAYAHEASRLPRVCRVRRADHRCPLDCRPIGNRTEYTEGTADALYYCANGLNQYTYTDDQSGTCPEPNTPVESFSHDADGNLTQDGDLEYTWDAENRLIGVAARNPSSGEDKKLVLVYDYLGRRVERAVYAWNPSAVEWAGDPETACPLAHHPEPSLHVAGDRAWPSPQADA